MPIEVRPIINRKRKKTAGRRSPKPTRIGRIPERATMTIGMRERLRAESRKRNKNQNPDGSAIPRDQLRPPLPPEKLMKDPRDKLAEERPIGRGMLIGGQAKLDKNKNGRIDAQDFKILKAEKAKGRGQGLQDEKMKPGKVTKAALGILAAGLGAKKAKDKKKMAPVAMGGIGLGMAKAEAIRKILGKNNGGMGDAKEYKKYLKGLKDVKDKTDLKKSKFIQRRMQLGGARALEAAKATRIGKIAAGVAGAALLGKAALEKMYEKRTGKKPFTKRPDKKMGGGMMKKPMSYQVGGDAFLKRRMKLGNLKSILPGRMKILVPAGIALGVAASKGADKMRKKLKEMKKNKKMGGGMMMRPNPVGYKTGKSVKVKCKLGRNKPTKMY